MSRTIIVASQAANKAKRVTGFNGTTGGDVRNHPDISPLWVGDVDAVVKQGNIQLRDDDSLLPDGDLTIYLIPTKNKAGMNQQSAEQLGKEIAGAIIEAARKSTPDEVQELRNELIAAIEDFFGVSLDNCPECDEALEEAKNL